MEHVSHKAAIKHANSSYCTVYEYPMQNGEMSIGVAKITDRYPSEGYAINHTCNEMGYIIKGSGKLVTPTRQVDLSVGDVVYIPRKEKFYWEGNITVVLPTAPAWNPQQHETVLDTEKTKAFL